MNESFKKWKIIEGKPQAKGNIEGEQGRFWFVLVNSSQECEVPMQCLSRKSHRVIKQQQVRALHASETHVNASQRTHLLISDDKKKL